MLKLKLIRSKIRSRNREQIECLVNKEMVGQDWEERQEILAKLEDVVTYLNDATEEDINFEE